MSDTETVVYLGNRQAVEVVRNPDDESKTVRRPVDGAPAKNCTTVRIPPGRPLLEVATEVAHLWSSHSDAPAPAWVASTAPAISSLLAEHWRCEVREPDPDHTPGGDTPSLDDSSES